MESTTTLCDIPGVSCGDPVNLDRLDHLASPLKIQCFQLHQNLWEEAVNLIFCGHAEGYPLVNVYVTMERSTILNG